MLADSPTYYWPLTDSGTTESENWPFFQVVPDYSGKNDDATAVGSTVTLGAAGNYSSSFAGAFTGSSGFLETSNQLASPSSFSLVAWFKAPSHSTGGMIVGFNSAQNGTGANHDRMIWMDNSGNIVAGSGTEARMWRPSPPRRTTTTPGILWLRRSLRHW